MRRSRLSAGAWLALSVGVLAVATLVAIGAALIASHHLTAGPPARGRPRRRRGQHGAGAHQRDGQPGDRRPRLRARRRGAVPRPLPRGRRGRRARSAPARRRSRAGRDGRPPAWRPGARRGAPSTPGSRATRSRRSSASAASAPGRIEDAAVAARQGALRCRARRARRACRPICAADRADARADLRERGRIAARARWSSRRSCWRWRCWPSPSSAGRSSPCPSRGWLDRRARSPPASCSRVIEPSGPSDIERLGRDVESMRARIVRDLEAVRAAEEEIQAEGGRARALQRRARAVRLRRLARPPGAAAQGDELLPDARAPLLGTARRARRAVHRLRRRRRQAHAGADQRPARLLARRARRAPARARRPRRARRRTPRARSRSRSRRRGATVEVRGDLPEVYGERSLLGLVLQNLISNAIKFHGDEPPRRARLGAPRRRALGARRGRQRHRHRPRVRRPDLRHLPAPARQGRLRGDRHRARDVPQGHRVPRRADLARASRNGAGSTFRFTLPVPDDIATEEAMP